jgi:hypothetical protein
LDIAAPTAAPARRAFLDFSFVSKAVLAAALVTLADWLFFWQSVGSTLALFTAVLLTALAATQPALRRSRAAWAAIGIALAATAALGDDPSPLALALFWSAASLAVLLPRAQGFDDAWRWALRLAWHIVRSVFGPLLDLPVLRAARRRRGGGAGLAARLPLLVMPALGSALFIALFAAANPLISNALSRISLATLFGGISAIRIVFWLSIGFPIWALLRPRPLVLRPRRQADPDFALPGVSLPSVTLSLLAFNLVFAVQNGLDLAFLWSGAALPEGMTLAEYAHRGAYPLIATALLAGLFVLVTLRPGSPLAASRPVRRLVYLWIAQNVLLVASTALRTLDYVDAYSLTRLRIAALIWMALVAVGLVLICWRIAARRSGAWLINANAAAALAVLLACSFVDLGAVAARWNVRHAREAGGRGAALDLCYLHDLGPSALLPLIELESRPLPAPTRERAAWVRNVILDRLEPAQADWRGWTYRNARRLDEAHRVIAQRRLPRFTAGRRLCDGTIEAPLTATTER